MSKWNGSSYGTTDERKFLYDGWNLICELNGSDVFLRGHAWGPDVSGSFDGAGGVGGLVLVRDKDLGSHFPIYDGNGNVTGYVKVTDGTESARNEYGPFGESIRRTAGSADSVVLSPIGFSSKYTHAETGLSYYGYRYYSPTLGRWLNRDPIEEDGGENLYAFAWNNAVSFSDVWGVRVTLLTLQQSLGSRSQSRLGG